MRSVAALLVLVLVASSIIPFMGTTSRDAAAGSFPSWTRVFHLHDGATFSASDHDWMNSSTPYNPARTDYDGDPIEGITLKKSGQPKTWHAWILDPAANSNINLIGDLNAYVWARLVDNNSGVTMNVRFYDIVQAQITDPHLGTLVGAVSVPTVGPDYSVYQRYNITVPGVSWTISPGHYLALMIERIDNDNNRLVIYYDKTDYDSFITLSTTTFVSISAAWTEDVLGNSRSVFSDQEISVAVANVTNPFGAYEITGAVVRVLNGTTEVVSPTPMNLVQTDPSPTKAWKRFNCSLPALSAGLYSVNVSASDPQGSPYWEDVPLTIVAVDHFNVTVPSAVTSYSNFAMTVSARDSSDAVITNWVGTVSLDTFLPDMVTGTVGSLSRTSVFISVGDAGQHLLTDQVYDFSEETIRIKAYAGTHSGWSASFDVLSGPVVAIELSPSGDRAYASGWTPGYSVTGWDANGYENTTWTPNWTASPSIGSVSGSGFSVTFNAITVGTGNISCTNDFNGAKKIENITVTAGPLARIDINPSADPLEIYESEEVVLTATGYDSFGNLVDMSSLMWDSNTTGSLTPTVGPTATYRAGFVPEMGTIHARMGTLTGTLNVTVLNGRDGPWFTPIPAQIANEDVGTWDLSLTGYWHDPQGTGTLTWWAEGVNTTLYFISHDPTSNSILRFFTQQDQFGEDEFRLWVIDTTGYRTYQDVAVRIMPVNDRPMFVNSVPSLFVRFDTSYSFDYSYYVWDVDNAKGDLTMTASITGNPVGSYVAFSGLIGTFYFVDESGGSSYWKFVSITVKDPLNAMSDVRIVVNVTDDHPPSLNQSLPDITMDEGQVMFFAFDLDLYFFDIDSATLYYTSGFHHVVVFINMTSHEVFLNATEEWSGTTEGTFTAKDPVGALKVDTIMVTVNPVNDAPRMLKDIGDVQVKHDEPYYLYLSQYVFDPDDSMDSLIFSFDNLNVSHTSSFMGSHRLEILFHEPPAVPYTATVRMTVTDPLGLSVTCEFRVFVTDNSPPAVVIANPDQLYYSFAEDTFLNNTLRLYDIFADPDEATLQFTIGGSTTVFAAVFENGVVNLTAYNNWSGTVTLNITAHDSQGGWSSVMAHVTVTPVNDAPVILQIPDLVDRGGSRNARYPNEEHPEDKIMSYVYDSDNDVNSLVITALPAESVAVVAGYLYVTLPSNVDVLEVTLQANDGDLDSNSVTFKVGVSKTMKERIGWPYSFPLVLLAAGVAGYFLASRIPRPYALENLFLIHNDGRLVAHVTKEENTTLDKDVVSAMFTAVQEFVRDSFQKGEVGLKKLEIGDKNVIIEKGKSAYVALIYSGWPDKDTFDMLPMLLRDVEERYKGRLEKWNGTMKTVKGVDKMLQEYMAGAYKPGTWHDDEELAEAQWVDMIEKEA